MSLNHDFVSFFGSKEKVNLKNTFLLNFSCKNFVITESNIVGSLIKFPKATFKKHLQILIYF